VDRDAYEGNIAAMTTLHFAYGANMSRAVMQKYAPGARALGVAVLADHRFVITADGYASVEPARVQTVHGVLWRITPRDRVMLDAWENVRGGLYRTEILAVRRKRCLAPSLVYFARPGAEGRPKPGYMELVLAAAREWDLPAAYIYSLEGFVSARPVGPDARKIGEFR
jgi:AIG2 family protein